jgi:cold shock CspA family protein
MSREPSPDDLARLAAPPPSEPKFVRRVGIGTVKWYRDTKGYGAISLPEIAPWDIWFHFSSIAHRMFTTLPSGERAELAADWDGHYFVETGERFVEGEATGDGTPLTIAAGDRVEVEFYRQDQESFKYIARIVRRLEG